jgi:diguanylate cyclase (GGDEF)-like protein
MRVPPRLSFRRPVVACAGILALAFVAAALRTAGTDWPLVGVAGAVAAAIVVVAGALPWARLPAGALLVLPVGCDAVIGLLRQAQGGSTSGYSALSILPVIWVGLVLGHREVAAIAACTTALFAVPVVLVGAPLYPGSSWRGVALCAVVAAIVGVGANRVIAEQRRQTGLAGRRAADLDRLVATQTAIATSPFDLDAVMQTIVEQALLVTGAAGAVVELPRGHELVYTAVAGTAAPYRGLRIAEATAISGEALRTRQVLTCDDSEHDPRVDRVACRRVGARSMIVVPLLHEGNAAGVLKVYAPTANAFEAEHARVLAVLASMIAAAIVRADLLDQLGQEAGTDALTGLANRRAWYRRLDEAVARARRSGTPLSVVLLDLDGFKQVNDEQGHAAGDRLLLTAAGRWTEVLRESDLLARLGGDEFGVVLEGADEAEAADVVGRLRDVVAASLSVSGGSATWDRQERLDELVERADRIMYLRKRAAAAPGGA